MKAGELQETKYVLDKLEVKTTGKIVSIQGKAWGHGRSTTHSVVLENKPVGSKLVPNVVGMGAKDAVYLLEKKGLKVLIQGIGQVKSQSIPSGTLLQKGASITLIMEQKIDR